MTVGPMDKPKFISDYFGTDRIRYLVNYTRISFQELFQRHVSIFCNFFQEWPCDEIFFINTPMGDHSCTTFNSGPCRKGPNKCSVLFVRTSEGFFRFSVRNIDFGIGAKVYSKIGCQSRTTIWCLSSNLNSGFISKVFDSDVFRVEIFHKVYDFFFIHVTHHRFFPRNSKTASRSPGCSKICVISGDDPRVSRIILK